MFYDKQPEKIEMNISPKDFKLPEDMSDARLYKQVGNSVCVSVIE